MRKILSVLTAIAVSLAFIPLTNAQDKSLPLENHDSNLLPLENLNLPLENLNFVWPARGILTSRYGERWGKMHRGIDIAAPTGSPIYAAAKGVVAIARNSRDGYGNRIDIKHSDGSMTRYGHCSRLLVQEGQEVEQGQIIGTIGSTGNSTGPHLHFEIHPPGDSADNPLAYLPGGEKL